MKMKSFTHWLIPLMMTAVSSCAVVSSEVAREAITDPAFEELLADIDQYIGQTMVMGGYVAQVRHHSDKSELVLIQAPLGMGQRPKSRDRSQGRLILEYDGFLDPEVYSRDRMVTVGGRVIGGSRGGASSESFPHVRLEVLDLYLWREPAYDPFWYDGLWWDSPGLYYRPYSFYPWGPRHPRHRY